MSTTSSAIERTALALAKAALSSTGPQSNGSEPSATKHKSGLSTGKAILLGAGLMAAGQAVVKSHGRDALNSVRHGLAEKLEGGRDPEDEFEDDGDLEEDDEGYEDEPEGDAEEDFDEEDCEDEPDDLEQDDYEDEDDEEFDDEEEDEEEDEEPRRQSRRRAATGGRRR